MKKQLLTLAFGVFAMSALNAQTVIFDNGPLFDLAGQGSGGANASTLHDGLSTYGAGHAVSSGFRVADDIVIGAGETWTIDSLVFFAYQTGSGNTSSITDVNVRIWDGVPGAGGSIIWGDSTTNVMIETDWSGTYRTGDFGSTTCAPATCIDRPIMRNGCTIGTTLAAGTYWIDWQVGGLLASGPWAPPVNLGAGITTTGNSMQYNPTGATWTPLTDGLLTTEAYGMPFLVIGSVTVGIDEIDFTKAISVYPNPATDRVTVSLDFGFTSNDNVTFTMYDVLGKTVQQVSKISSRQLVIERQNMNNGVYFYEVTVGDKSVKNGKIVLQ